MLSLLNTSASFFDNYGIILILLAALVIMFIFSSFKNRDVAKQRFEFLNTLKLGDRVKTYGGLYGTVEEIADTTDGKIVLIRSGEGKKSSYSWLDINAVYALDKKSAIASDLAVKSENGVDVEVFTGDADVKRKRGRPRKVLTEEEIAKKAATPKRGRGRPRKTEVTVTVETKKD